MSITDQAPYPIPYTLCPMPYALYPMPYTLYPIPYTLYPIPYTLYPIPYTLYPNKSCTLNLQPCIPNPKYTENLSLGPLALNPGP